MLILTRKPGESLFIGDEVKVTIIEIKGNQIRIGISAPKDLRIYREEIYLQIIEENKEAAGLLDEEEMVGFSAIKPGEGSGAVKKLVVKPVSGMNLAKGSSSSATGNKVPASGKGAIQEGSQSFAKLNQQVSRTVVIKKKRNPTEGEK